MKQEKLIILALKCKINMHSSIYCHYVAQVILLQFNMNIFLSFKNE